MHYSIIYVSLVLLSPTVSALCLSAGVVLLRDNACPYSAVYTAKTLQWPNSSVTKVPGSGAPCVQHRPPSFWLTTFSIQSQTLEKTTDSPQTKQWRSSTCLVHHKAESLFWCEHSLHKLVLWWTRYVGKLSVYVEEWCSSKLSSLLVPAFYKYSADTFWPAYSASTSGIHICHYIFIISNNNEFVNP